MAESKKPETQSETEGLKLYFYPAHEDVLRKPTSDVPESSLSDAIQKGTQMLAFLKITGDLGLSAPQVGLTDRILALNIPNGFRGVMINPKTLLKSKTWNKIPEGCLSFPGVQVRVRRSDTVKVSYLDIHGKPQYAELKGLSAIAYQHELDHLNGKLFIDYLSEEDQAEILAAYEETKEEKDESNSTNNSDDNSVSVRSETEGSKEDSPSGETL